MRCGAFVDMRNVTLKYKEEELFTKPETPPFKWLLRSRKDTDSSDPDTVLASSPADENSAALLNTATTTTVTTNPLQNNNNASVKSLEKMVSTSPTRSTELGTSPTSLNEFRRSSSRWSTRTLPSDDEKLLKELHIPFAMENTRMSELAKFYRECSNAPPLQQGSESSFSSSGGGATGTAATGIGKDSSEDEVDSDEGASTLAGAHARNSSVDDLTSQLEKFEISLNDYDTLVTSLCQQGNEMDGNSNS